MHTDHEDHNTNIKNKTDRPVSGLKGAISVEIVACFPFTPKTLSCHSLTMCNVTPQVFLDIFTKLMLKPLLNYTRYRIM